MSDAISSRGLISTLLLIIENIPETNNYSRCFQLIARKIQEKVNCSRYTLRNSYILVNVGNLNGSPSVMGSWLSIIGYHTYSVRFQTLILYNYNLYDVFCIKWIDHIVVVLSRCLAIDLYWCQFVSSTRCLNAQNILKI